MIPVSIIQWWYTKGWKITSGKLSDRLKNAADFFSIRLLVGNLFAPFRQISAGEKSASGDMWFSVFLDKLLSRLVGTVVRFGLLIIGVITIILQAIWGIALVVIWPIIPVMPVGCIVIALVQMVLS